MVCCPKCGKTATGERLHRILREQAAYLYDKIEDDTFNEGLADVSSIRDDLQITYEPGKEPLDPVWCFHFTLDV